MRHWKEISIVFIYFLTRFTHLTIVPIFNDESTYIRYGLHHVLEPQHLFYSLLIGKEPLLPYLFAQFSLMFGDPLFGSRLVAVMFGFLTLLGIFYTTRLIWNKNTAYIASLIYILTPFTLFFDRLALMDTAISTISIWSMYLVFKIVKKPYWYHAALLGIVLGTGMWIKTSASFFLILAPLTILFYVYFKRNDAKRKIKFSFSALSIALIIFALLYFNPLYAVHKQLLTQYVYPTMSIFQFNFMFYADNASKLFMYIFFFLTPPVVLSAIYGVKNWKDKKIQLLLIWFLPPVLYMSLFSKLLTSRHALLLSVPLILLAANSIADLKRKTLVAVLSIALLWMITVSSSLYISPQQFPNMFPGTAKNDIRQYFYGFSSGYGVEESINYLKNKAEKENITVIIRDDTGNPEDAIMAYLYYDPKFTIIPIRDRTTILNAIKDIDTDIYFVSRGPQYAGLEEHLDEEKIFQKPHDAEFVGVYKLNKQSINLN